MASDSITSGRRIVGNISLSLDGRVTGPGGDHDMGWVARHAVTDTARELAMRQTSTATTVLLGRKNYEGFFGYWPTVATDESADPRDRALAQWLDSVEKVVFSTTLTSVEWSNARLAAGDPVAIVKQLRSAVGGDIVVQNSVSIIRQLLAADEIDRLTLTFCPEIVGGGKPLFEDGVPMSSWTLTDLLTADTGAMCLYYDRLRGDS
ncbi:MAG: dihydrofolate reductase family protein [Nocardioidaceae bacterium]